MDEKSAVEKLQKRYAYNNNFIRTNYDRIALTMPKGTKERIAKTGMTANALIRDLLLSYLDEQGV